MQHKMNLHDAPFQKIYSGAKDVEMRLYDEKRQAMVVGDTILFTNATSGAQLTAEVVDLQVFATFEELYGAFDNTRIGYGANEVACPDDMLQYYSSEKIVKYGAVAICLKVIP